MPALIKILIVLACVTVVGCASSGRDPMSMDQLQEMGFSKQEVVELGQLVTVAYRLFRADESNPNPAFPAYFKAGFTPLMNLQARDKKGREREFYGHLSWLDESPGTLVISIRGTSDKQEWTDNFKFSKVEFSESGGYGKVERGFDEIYASFVVSAPDRPGTIAFKSYLSSLAGVERVIVVGHSLGSSLATLVAADLSLGDHAGSIRLLTFASPLTGNQAFVNAFEQRIKRSVRVVNHPDLVPRVPLRLFGFRHIWHQLEVDSSSSSQIRESVACYHNLQTYLHLLDPQNCLKPECATESFWPENPQCVRPPKLHR